MREATVGFGAEFVDVTQGALIRGYDVLVYLPDETAIQAWEVWWQERTQLGATFLMRDPRQADGETIDVMVRLANEKLALQFLADNRATCKLRLVETTYEPAAFEDADEEPLWLYEFQPGSGAKQYLTSYQSALTINGATWLAAPITHGSIREALNGDKNDCTLTTGFFPTNPLAARVPFAPATVLHVRIFRSTQRGSGAELMYHGIVGTVTLDGNQLKAILTNERRLFDAQIPRFYFQERCNHALYSSACGVRRTGFDSAGTITSITRGRLTVSDGAITGKAANWFANGYCVVGSEKMAIVRSLGATLWLSAPLRLAAVGNAITAYAGCNKTGGQCGAKFNNFDNFGGHPRIPRENLNLKAVNYDAAIPAGGK